MLIVRKSANLSVDFLLVYSSDSCRAGVTPCPARPHQSTARSSITFSPLQIRFAVHGISGFDQTTILSEYGADTIAGMHGTEMFTEEFQVDYYKTINACLDERPFVVGETPWNFADFGTQQGPMRAGGNRKGLFTRDRKPKMAAHYFRQRWENFKK